MYNVVYEYKYTLYALLIVSCDFFGKNAHSYGSLFIITLISYCVQFVKDVCLADVRLRF